jgi:signal transduction histidine kinase
MSPELAQLVGGWPWAVPVVATLSTRGLLAGRRRATLNEALHELRRPLQALALAPPDAAGAGVVESSLEMASAALEQLDREINGGAAASLKAPLAARPLLEAAASRWQRCAALAGGTLRLRWAAAEATVRGNRAEISQALDNLIVNAIEHGGPEVVVAATLAPGELRLSVADSARDPRRGHRVSTAVWPIVRLGGRCRHGHGLRVVRRVAAAHGGSFRLRRSPAGTEAVLCLPLAGRDPA